MISISIHLKPKAMKNLIFIFAMLISVTTMTSCKKYWGDIDGKAKSTSPYILIHCDISYKISGETYELKQQAFSGTADEVDVEKSKIVTTFTKLGYTDISIHNCN